jgi:hypothetical protein
VAAYTYDKLPPAEQKALPNEGHLVAALEWAEPDTNSAADPAAGWDSIFCRDAAAATSSGRSRCTLQIMADTKMTKSAGEHWVCSVLARHGWAAALTRDGLERTGCTDTTQPHGLP